LVEDADVRVVGHIREDGSSVRVELHIHTSAPIEVADDVVVELQGSCTLHRIRNDGDRVGAGSVIPVVASIGLGIEARQKIVANARRIEGIEHDLAGRRAVGHLAELARGELELETGNLVEIELAVAPDAAPAAAGTAGSGESAGSGRDRPEVLERDGVYSPARLCLVDFTGFGVPVLCFTRGRRSQAFSRVVPLPTAGRPRTGRYPHVIPQVG